MSSVSREHTTLPRLDNGFFDVAPRTDWQKSIVERNARESPLLSLPRELRDLIWTHTFTRTVKPDKKEILNSAFSPLVACRQIYAEAASLACPLLIWSFRCWPHYEDWFWNVYDKDEDNREINQKDDREKKSLVRFIQIGVDTTDLYSFAEIEDPGTDDENDEDETAEAGHYNPTLRATFRAFRNLSHLELLLSATPVYEDYDTEDDSGEELEDHELQCATTLAEQAKQNFTSVMRQKLPHVCVTYKEFATGNEMRRYWRDQDPWLGASQV